MSELVMICNQPCQDYSKALSDINQKDHVGHKENQWGPSNCQPLYLKKMYDLSPAKFNMHFLSFFALMEQAVCIAW